MGAGSVENFASLSTVRFTRTFRPGALFLFFYSISPGPTTLWRMHMFGVGLKRSFYWWLPSCSVFGSEGVCTLASQRRPAPTTQHSTI
jgi:hypothetical protein